MVAAAHFEVAQQAGGVGLASSHCGRMLATSARAGLETSERVSLPFHEQCQHCAEAQRIAEQLAIEEVHSEVLLDATLNLVVAAHLQCA